MGGLLSELLQEWPCYYISTLLGQPVVLNEAGSGQIHFILECGTWYHHPRRLQYVWSRNLRISKVATWYHRCRHNLKNNCIWDNLQCCLLVPRSPSKPVMLTFDLQSRRVYLIDIVFLHVYPRKTITILAFIDGTLPLQFAPGANLSQTWI